MTDDLLRRLAVLDSCAASDALDQLGHRGAATGILPLSIQKRIVGRAITVRLGPDDGRTTRRHLCTAAVEAGGPGTVIVIAHENRTDVAGWGGILSLAAVMRRIEGVIIDGACRDLDESRDLRLPIYGRTPVPVTARGRIVEHEWNVPIEVAGVAVAPEDLVIADASGVVFIPRSLAESAIARAQVIARKERLIADAVRRGDPVSQAMGANYERMLEEGSR